MSKTATTIGLLSTAVITAAVVASPALAWHPQGVITKYVQNVTTGSAMSDANDAAHAVAAKPGDVLKYTIVVGNNGTASSNGMNDMAKTVMTDTLPAGVALTDGASGAITENIGTVKPGLKVTKEYTVKVTATKSGLIENKACFTGNSTANDNPQSGCDVADVNVTVPTPPVTPPQQPTPPVQPQQPVTPAPAPQTPAALPDTAGASPLGEVLGAGTGAGAIGYAGVQYLRAKRNLKNAK